MLKTETQVFGFLPPAVDKATGKTIDPGRPGVEITCTQMPCSLQREVFAWLIEQSPDALPEGVLRAKGGGKLTADGGLNFAYRWCRAILSAKGGIAYLQKQFGQHSVAKVNRNGTEVREPLDEGLCDELFGARISILLEWLVFNLIFNFADVVNLLPDWGKGIPSIVAAVMMDGAAEPAGEGKTE